MSMTDFIESPRFPENISYGSRGGPGFKTFIFEGHSGIEQRNLVWSRAKGRWDVTHGIRDKTDMDQVRAFFYMCRGRGVGFRFKDWADYQLVDEQIGVGDGATRVFKLTKTYGSTNQYVRRIFKPVQGTLSVKVNNVSRNLGSSPNQVNVDYTKGILTFGTNIIPALGEPITVTCEFDVPVRFDVDHMNASHEGYLAESWDDISIVELMLEDT